MIDDGIFKGFIPINHHWVNDDPNVYYDISNSVNTVVKVRRIDKRRFSAFDLDGYQVVRSQFVQMRYEGPSITISDGKITFNIFCMKKFGSVGYVQLLLHPTERKLAIRPCGEKDTHSIRWRPNPEKPVYSKTLSCLHFGKALYSIMEWNPDYMYKIRGIRAKRGEEQIIVFDLVNAVPAVSVTSENRDTPVKRRVELCPDEWTDDFGEEFYEHILENSFYYIAQDTDWQVQTESIPAPGMRQYSSPTDDELQMSIDNLKKGTSETDGNQKDRTDF